MGISDVSKVLASESRWKILSALTKEPKDVRSIVKEVSIQPTAVRYHLQALLRLGLIESYEEKVGVGRPKIFYRLSKKQVMVGFPPRHYLFLSEILFDATQKLPDQDRVRNLLYKTSFEQGKTMMEELASQHGVEKWSPELFDKYFVKTFLPQFGIEAETTSLRKSEVVYRNYICPFQELSSRYPKIICDIIHDGWLHGIGDAMKAKLKIQRRKCMGHGDDYCEVLIQWLS